MSYKCANCNEVIENHTPGDNCPHCGFDDVKEVTDTPPSET